MQIEAGKLDWLKERKDFNTNPVARAATRLLEHQYMPHGEDLYPWILREIKRGNIRMPSAYRPKEEGGNGAWLELVKMEMRAERELARRQHLIDTDPNLTNTDSWHDDRAIDWDDIENASGDRLYNFVHDMSRGDKGQSPWQALNATSGGLRFEYAKPVEIPGPDGLPPTRLSTHSVLDPKDLGKWGEILKERAKRRQGVDPMQFSAPELAKKMHEEWLPEWEERQRQGLGQVIHQFPDRWTIRRLQNAEEAHQEGEDMGHCIGSYGEDAEDGRTHLFSLRDPQNRPHASWEIRPNPNNLGQLPASVFQQFNLDPYEDMGRVRLYLENLQAGFGGQQPYPTEEEIPLSQKGKNALAMAQALLNGGYEGAPTEPWHKGRLIQVQGKENSKPIPEYQDRIRQWFASMPEEHWPANLSETSYYPPSGSGWGDLADAYYNPPNDERDDPFMNGLVARTMEHYPAPAHKSVVTGRICHCPWGPERELWSWNEKESSRLEDSRPRQRDDGSHRSDPVANQIEREAAVTDSRVAEVDPALQRTGEVPLVTTHGGWCFLAAEDVSGTLGEGQHTLGAQSEVIEPPAVGVPDRPDRLSPAASTVPAEVAERTASVEEDPEVRHNRRIIADWDPDSEWDWYDEGEAPEDYEVPEFGPWQKGQDGKGLISPEGQIITWNTNAMGDPHHDTVSAEQGFPYAAKLAIRPNGEALIPSPDQLHLFGMDRDTAEAHLAREAPKHGLRVNRGYTSKARLCPTCNDPLKGEYGTFCPRCEWSENDANMDSDPLSNPPDPTLDLHRGIQSSIIPSHRWGKWLAAVSDL